MTHRIRVPLPLVGLLALALAGCSDPVEPGAPAPAPSAGAVAPRSFLLSVEPPGAVGVRDALAQAVGAEVTVVGRLQKKHATLASFRLTDDAVEDCLRCGMPGGCKTPWDYCCHKDEMLKSSLTVELRNASGQPEAVAEWGIRELDLVVVKGVLAKGDGARPILLVEGGWFLRDRPKTPAGLRWP